MRKASSSSCVVGFPGLPSGNLDGSLPAMKTPHAPGWLAVGFLAMTAATGLAVGADAPATVPYRPGYIVGADISSVPAAEARGMKYSDNGAQKDILQILKDHGFNYIRLRLFVEPKNPGGYSPQGWCDLPHTVPMAQRVKKAGMGLLLDFHYSDTWADPGKQTKPLAWRQLPPDALVQTLRDYTRDAIAQLKAAGGEPDMVQIGNEITPGMLLNTLPGGRGGGAQRVSTQPEGSATNWDILSALLKAGISGVKDVDPRILIVLHIDKGGDNAASRSWVDAALAHGVSFDILGESCYTRYQGPPSSWKANFDDLAARYPKLSFLVAEVAYETTESNEIMHNLPDHRGLGTFIWEPTQRGNQQQLFDNNGAVIPEKMALYDRLVKDYAVNPY
jgi:arabinogalactan endo-1,4-beta-galactosidase